MTKFKTVKAETSRLEILPILNSNAYVFVRDVDSPSDISIFRSVFVHFLVEATKQFTSLAATPSVARATYWAHRASPLIIPATASSEMKQVGRWRGPISHLLLKRTTWKTRWQANSTSKSYRLAELTIALKKMRNGMGQTHCKVCCVGK
ncbi:hypothetical protein PC129_g15162 [Phytophthora cactorum]|uniref:Uncharacterized protein n=1 Tax=Phytophthora cactorum TaxID=29920 RepID=A0A329RRU7_9STRA|nr:hypothetical protein Pcac1_g11426 [Phytophthora cactorum]KAG2808240.1 hypothetical protein PC111_g16584 [Phytophthora cactorum]KAG2847859.1 hypothetical protein PC113_g17679 [Phytophthora cactorum]KAG2896994.1 hypothetical protein PC114_g14843 [Phytophthora cactorum]KAG2975974.1 hypothetical protein PC118_g13645 [Phytophthora cactorum]